MKRTTLSLSRLCVAALAVSTIALAGHAQADQTRNPNGVPDSVTDNPHLSRSSNTAQAPAKALAAQDKNFISKAASGGMMEVQMGEMAQKMGKSAEVKQIGATMVNDHTKANNEPKAIAQKKGLSIGSPTKGPGNMGADFDRQYLSQMVSDHQQDIALFQTEAKSGSDPDVKAFASRTLPVIQHHLAMVKQALGKTSGSTKTASKKQS